MLEKVIKEDSTHLDRHIPPAGILRSHGQNPASPWKGARELLCAWASAHQDGFIGMHFRGNPNDTE